MGPLTFIWHGLSFLAPALFVAMVLPLVGRLVARKVPSRWSWHGQVGLQLAVGVAVLMAGMVFFGVDGKMLTYLALALCCGTCQWLMAQGHKG